MFFWGLSMDVADHELVQQAQDGSRQAFSTLVRRHSREVYRLALRMSGNRSDAEEIVQQTCLQLHRKLASFRGESRFTTWLHRIAVNEALMHLRAGKRHEAEPLDDHLPEFDKTGTLARLDVDYSLPARADQMLETKQLADAALAAVAELPEHYRHPFVLRDLEGLETDEIASLLSIEPALVRQRLHRARLLLRNRLGALLEGPA